MICPDERDFFVLGIGIAVIAVYMYHPMVMSSVVNPSFSSGWAIVGFVLRAWFCFSLCFCQVSACLG